MKNKSKCGTVISFTAALFSICVFLTGFIFPAYGQETKDFSQKYTTQGLLQDSKQLKLFETDMLKAESPFFKADVGYSSKTGMTYDGSRVDSETAHLSGASLKKTSASKESIHLLLLALAVDGNEKATILVSADNPRDGGRKAMEVLSLKIRTYDEFNRRYPGFGGFLPWVVEKNGEIQPAVFYQKTDSGSDVRVRSLENGEWAWALFLTSYILEKRGYTELAGKYKAYWQMLAKNALPVFFDRRSGQIRSVAGMVSFTNKQVKSGNYYDCAPGTYLNGPWEGELFVLFASLFREWDNEKTIQQIWKTKKLEKSAYYTKQNEAITVRKGFWNSASESWNFLFLPYRDDPLVANIFYLGEVARTTYSFENKIPGLFASWNPSSTPAVDAPDSGKDSGGADQKRLAETAVKNNTPVSPSAAFPVILADKRAGLAWYHTMISDAGLAASDRLVEQSASVSPHFTWDAKILTVLALMEPEIMHNMRDALMAYGRYRQFRSYVANKYASVFVISDLLEGMNLKVKSPDFSVPALFETSQR